MDSATFAIAVATHDVLVVILGILGIVVVGGIGWWLIGLATIFIFRHGCKCGSGWSTVLLVLCVIFSCSTPTFFLLLVLRLLRTKQLAK